MKKAGEAGVSPAFYIGKFSEIPLYKYARKWSRCCLLVRSIARLVTFDTYHKGLADLREMQKILNFITECGFKVNGVIQEVYMQRLKMGQTRQLHSATAPKFL